MAISIVPDLEFNFWTVIEKDTSRHGNPRWMCRCRCGAIRSVVQQTLVSGTSRSCGCESRKSRESHGLSKTPEYQAWLAMKERCYNRKVAHFDRYGGRGITVCDRWLNSFTDFLADIGHRPSETHSLDRFPNSDGNYEPGNVRWATKAQQANNRKTVILYEYAGKKMSLSEWAADNPLGLSHDCLRGRIVRMGWTFEKAITTPRITGKGLVAHLNE